MFDFLEIPYEHELHAFGKAWCGPDRYETHKETLVARYESADDDDGQSVEIYCTAMPARFYTIRALAGKNSVGEPKPAFEFGTGCSMAQLAADMGKAISEGMLGWASSAERSSGGTGGQRHAFEALTHTTMENQTDSSAPPVPLARLVERWVQTAIRVQDTFGKIENAFMASPENEIRSAIWGMFGEYTRTLAAQLSDDAEDARGWLEWFAWECDFGRKPMEMVFANGETLMVVGASDLLAAIRTDDHGNRVWDSPLNAELSHPESKP